MNKLFYKLKNDKLLLVISAVVSAIVLFDIFVIVFDIVQFAKLAKNSVDLISSFSALNIVAGVVSAVADLLVLFYLIFGQRRIKTKIKTKTK